MLILGKTNLSPILAKNIGDKNAYDKSSTANIIFSFLRPTADIIRPVTNAPVMSATPKYSSDI